MSSSGLVERFRSHVAAYDLLGPNRRVLIGVSGGIDSMVLLDLLIRIGADCHVVHVNYGTRGTESDGDEEVVRTFCSARGIDLSVASAPTGWADQPGSSMQDAAREIRYALFERVANARSIAIVAVAHNLNDQAETVLLQLMRGTGLRGFGGMRRRRPLREGPSPELVRPLLDFARADLLDHAREAGVPYREDASNTDPRFARSRLRNEVVPALLNAFGAGAVENIGRSASRIAAVVDDAVIPALEEALAGTTRRPIDGPSGESVPPELSVQALLSMQPDWRRAVLFEVLRRWVPAAPLRSSSVDQVARLLDAPVGSRALIGDTTMWRTRDSIVFGQEEDGQGDSWELGLGERIHTPAGVLSAEVASPLETPVDDAFSELVNGDRLVLPLVVDRWRPGDRFQPLGMSGVKKVSDFLNDRKVDPHRKKAVLVARSDGEIVWVVGHRLAAPFRLTQQTGSMVRLTLDPTGG